MRQSVNRSQLHTKLIDTKLTVSEFEGDSKPTLGQ